LVISSFCSKYVAQETWEEVSSAFVCKAKARVNRNATVLCKHIYGVWHERAKVWDNRKTVKASEILSFDREGITGYAKGSPKEHTEP